MYGIDVTGDWGVKWLVAVKDGKFEVKPEEGNFEGGQAVFTFDPSDFVLTASPRFQGGQAPGDPDMINEVRNLFFTI